MGNSQSRSSDSDEENNQSHYNYHEKVLREAQQLSTSNRRGHESDDQYFSAEEGDSDRSITPPRNRPESSSGEDFSDDSDNEEIERKEVLNETGTDTSRTSVSASASASGVSLNHELVDISTKRKSEFVSPGVPKWRVKTSCGQCNVSRFQEHDSIGPELDASQWDVSPGCSSAILSTRQSQSNSGDFNQSNISNPTVFKPIKPSRYNRSSSGYPSKHSCDTPPSSSASPPKMSKMICISPNKRRLGMLDEFDLDSDDEVQFGKRARLITDLSSARKRRQAESPLSLRGNQSKRRSGSCEDVDNASVRATGESCNTKMRIAFRTGTTKREKDEGRNKDDSESDETEESFCSSVNKKSKCEIPADIEIITPADSCVSETRNSLQSSATASRSTCGAFQPLGRKRVSVVITRLDDEFSQEPVSGKMGRRAVRNSQGKVLPSLQSNNSTSPASSPAATFSQSATALPVTSHSDCQSSQNSHSDSSLVNKSNSKLKLKKISINKESDENQEQSIKESHTSSNCAVLELSASALNPNISVLDVSGGMVSESDGISNMQDNKGESQTDDQVCRVSPFQNVVLTPPSGRELCNINQQGAHSLGRVAGDTDVFHGNGLCPSLDRGQEEEDLMETEDCETSGGGPSLQPGHRVPAKAKRPTASDRLKTFFNTESLKSNLKSLFSRQNDGQRGSRSSAGLESPSTWSLYTSLSTPSSSTSLAGQSTSSNPPHNFQSTSSPFETSRRSAAHSASINFSPIMSSATNATDASPLSMLSCHQMNKPSPPSLGTSPPEPASTAKATPVPIRTRSSQRLRIPLKSSPSAATPSRDSANHNHFEDSLDSSGSGSFPADIEILSQTSQFQVLCCRLAQTVEVSVTMADIAMETSSGIVNWTDGSLTHGVTGPSRRVCARAGALMRAACHNYLEHKEGLLEPPDVLTTPAGGSFSRTVRHLLHVVCPAPTRPNLATCLLEVNANCLRFANERLCLTSLSLPLIGEGELPIQLCATAFIDAVLIFIAEKQQQHQPLSSPSSSNKGFQLTAIRLVTEDVFHTDQAADAIQARIRQIQSEGLNQTVADVRAKYSSTQDLSPARGNNASPQKADADRAQSGRPCVKRRRL